MFNYPEHLYTDIRIENRKDTKINFKNGTINEIKEDSISGVFLRIFDGETWYYSSFVGRDKIQDEIYKLTKKATPNKDILKDPIVDKFEVNREEILLYSNSLLQQTNNIKKIKLMEDYFPLLSESSSLIDWNAEYTDFRTIKEFYSSKGAQIKYDIQRAGLAFLMTFVAGDNVLTETYEKTSVHLDDLYKIDGEISEYIKICEDYVNNAQSIEPGNYPVIFSSVPAGIFAHECFGHRSEADFMIGSTNMLENYTLGNKIAGDNVSIFDSGKETQYEYLPYDDEGTKAKKTYMIKDGYLNSRLHKVATAVELNEDLTSNARAIDYTYEPMVRMTTTCFDTGTCKKEDLFADVEKGIFVDTILGGAGMSVFNFSPNRSYLIENGKITKPVTVSLITGVVDEALNDIEKLSLNSNTEVKLTLFCGKPDQFGLRVGIGGPYIRVKKLNVR